MYFKKSNVIRLLILTDFNVSNVHYMVAQYLQQDLRFEPLFLDFNRNPDFHDDFNWFIDRQEKSSFNLSKLFMKDNAVKRLWNTIKLIRKGDIVFTSGKIALLVYLCRKPYIYFSYGSDLDQYSKYGDCTFGVKDSKRISPLRRFLKRYIINPIIRQLYRLAIQKADTTIIAQYQHKDISKLGYKRLGFFPHPLETDFRSITLDDKKKNKKWIQDQYDCERILFSSTRHVWDRCYSETTDFKGNNIIIETLSSYLEQTGDKRIKLFLIEKGPDVELSKQLIRERGLEEYIIWLEPMPRKKLIEFYSGADVFFDEFGRGCLALCTVEAMSCGTPTASYIGKRNLHVPFYPKPPYLLNTKDVEEICNYLVKFFSDDTFKQNEEERTFRWIRENCSLIAICDAFFQMSKTITDELTIALRRQN